MAALVCASLTLIFLSNKYILTVNFYERNGQALSGIPDMQSLVYDQIKNLIYIYAFFYLVIKVLLIATLLATGLFFFDTAVSFRRLILLVIRCEFIFLIPAAVKLLWFWQERKIVDLVTWQNFYFLSAAMIIPDIKPALLLPLQTINAFEIAYWFLLAAGIAKVALISFDKALRIVCLSYIPALLIWITFLVYLTIVYFPGSY